jgi:hypothetical protein
MLLESVNYNGRLLIFRWSDLCDPRRPIVHSYILHMKIAGEAVITAMPLEQPVGLLQAYCL